MIKLIQHVNPTIMEEVRLRCDDSFHDDFKEEIYEQAIFKGMKKIARNYDLLQRYIKFTNTIILNPADDITTEEEKKLTDIELPIKSFRDEYKVIVGSKDNVLNILAEDISTSAETNAMKFYNYTKVTDHNIELNKYEYHLYRGLNSWLFNYSPRGIADEVIIYYIMDPELDDYENEETTPVLPSKYDEELQRQAIMYISKLGIAKFRQDKKNKYATLYTLEKGEREDSKIEPHRASIMIKPFKYP